MAEQATHHPIIQDCGSKGYDTIPEGQYSPPEQPAGALNASESWVDSIGDQVEYTAGKE